MLTIKSSYCRKMTTTTMSKSLLVFGCLFTVYLSRTIAQSSEQPVSNELSVCMNVLDLPENRRPTVGQHCIRINNTLLQCYGYIDDIPMSESISITELILCSWPKIDFDPTVSLKGFPSIRILRIENSTELSYFHNDFPSLKYLESINISWTKMAKWRPTLFSDLQALKFVDLRWNSITHMEKPLLAGEHFKGLYLTDNPWNCALNMWWLLNSTMNQHIFDRDKLMCNETSAFKNRPVMVVMEYKQYLSKACANNTELKRCTCEVSYIRLGADHITLTPMNSVNCSGRHLQRLPSTLPENTTQLLASHNEITNVDLLNTPTYRDVHDVFLDFNSIESIEILESTDWLKSFRIFSLQGNKFTKVPVYAIENALEANKQFPILNLSQNPWMCDCNFATRFQELLLRFNAIIRDSQNVTCNKYIEGDPNFGQQVLKLRRGDFCKMPKEYKVQPLDLLNGVLATLIILILSKLGYDYYHYRKSGRLPWIVSKFP